jgi:hypothetical protein
VLTAASVDERCWNGRALNCEDGQIASSNKETCAYEYASAATCYARMDSRFCGVLSDRGEGRRVDVFVPAHVERGCREMGRVPEVRGLEMGAKI